MKLIIMFLLLVGSLQAQEILTMHVSDHNISQGYDLFISDYAMGEIAWVDGGTYNDSIPMFSDGEIILDSIYTSSIVASIYSDTVTTDTTWLKITIDNSTAGTYADTITLEFDGYGSPKTCIVTATIPWTTEQDTVGTNYW